MFGRLYGLDDPDAAARQGLERFDVTHLARNMGNELSSGQRTLVGIIKATLHRPQLLVLDEPTASLDPDVALRVRSGLASLCEDEGTALLVTSHNMVEIERLCERVVFISAGRVVADGIARPSRGALRSRRPRRRVPAPRRTGRGVATCTRDASRRSHGGTRTCCSARRNGGSTS